MFRCNKLVSSAEIYPFVQKVNNPFSLSFSSYGDHVQHFRVLKDGLGQYFVWDEVFSSLNQLVDFYKINSIAKERTVFLQEPEGSLAVRSVLNSILLRCQSSTLVNSDLQICKAKGCLTIEDVKINFDLLAQCKPHQLECDIISCYELLRGMRRAKCDPSFIIIIVDFLWKPL